MKTIHLVEVKLIDGSKYRGEIAYRDDRMIVMRFPGDHQKKMRLYHNGIISIQELGWQKEADRLPNGQKQRI